MDAEYQAYLQREITALNKELDELTELPEAYKLRNRIKADQRNIQSSIDLFKEITQLNTDIKLVKERKRAIEEETKRIIHENRKKKCK